MNMTPSLIQNQLINWLLRRTPSGGVRRIATLSAALASDVGNVREDNQDRAAAIRGRDQRGREYVLVAVADGIGGMQDGATCAAMAIAAFVAAIDRLVQTAGISNRPDDLLREGAHAANEEVFSKFRASGGSTLVALLLIPGLRPYWLSIGDSRVYCMDDKALIQTSIDDTIAGQLGKNPEDSSEQSRLLQFVGMGPDLEPHVAIVDAESIDAVILTTDGVHFLSSSPGWMSQIVRHSPDPGICVKRLIDLAKWCGGPDNASVAMISLPVETQTETKLDYPCLEVWDAYGELQLISPPTSTVRASNSALPANPHASSMPESNAASVAPIEPVIDGAHNSPLPDAPRSRRGKVARKPKKSQAEPSLGLDKSSEEPEMPQLHMEFPTRSSEQGPEK